MFIFLAPSLDRVSIAEDTTTTTPHAHLQISIPSSQTWNIKHTESFCAYLCNLKLGARCSWCWKIAIKLVPRRRGLIN
jgi:hypothetical protein